MTTQTMTLVDFLHDRLDEDEAVARGSEVDHLSLQERPGFDGESPEQRVVGGMAHGGAFHLSAYGSPGFLAHVARHDPARVLAEVDAKRRIMAQAERWAEYIDATRETDSPAYRHDAVSLSILGPLALAYVDHPDYRDEWRP